jgi:alpha-tubulin suppressor-like RCC1 family protein
LRKSGCSLTILTAFAILTLAGCGGGGGSSPPPASSGQWGKISATNNESNRVSITGTAWVSPGWVALHCVGLGCLSDVSYDNYPGVDVTYINLTTGASGTATSYYGGGTGWEHEWAVTVPIMPGENTIQISAYDPDGRGGSIDTVKVNGTVVYIDVVSSMPPNGASDVPVNASISAAFSESVDPSSVNASSFLVSGPAGSVAGTVTVSGTSATFTPAVNLAYQSEYTVTITTSVRDIWGSTLLSNVVWTFTTGITPDSTPPTTPSGLIVSLASTSQIDLSWSPATDNASVQGYKLYRNTAYLKSVPSTTASDTGLYLKTQYCYAVSAYDEAGNESALSGQACFSTTDLPPGNAAAWGKNSFGQLGDGTAVDRLAPVQVSSTIQVTAIAAGAYHSLALASDGIVWAWGHNDWYQLGDGTNIDKSSPVQVPNLTDVIAISAGAWHSIALKSNGTVWAWGLNGNGALGDGTTTLRSYPVQVLNLTGVIAVSAGVGYSLALKSDGTVWAWGYNWAGTLGNGSNTDSSVPVQVSNITQVIAISAGANHALALRSDGTVWAWGYNDSGQLGDGTTINRLTPVQVLQLSGITAVSAGGEHSLALAADGSVSAWGYNGYGQLGNDSQYDQHSPVASQITGAVAVAAGSVHSMAITKDGAVWAWGGNQSGQLGTGSTSNCSVPVQIQNLNDITAVAAGDSYSMALRGN